MRYMLRNVIRDPRFNKRRAANPGKINRRPVIGGKPLPPGGTKFLRVPNFTPQMLDEIEAHQKAGNVQLVLQGRTGGEVDIAALRQQLWPTDEATNDTAEEELAAEESDVTPDEEEEGDIEPNLADIEAVEDAIDAQPEDDEEDEDVHAAESTSPPPEDSAEMDLEDVLDPEPEPEPEPEEVPYNESELMGHSKSDLQDIWKTFFPDKKPGARSKQTLTDEVLEAQGA